MSSRIIGNVKAREIVKLDITVALVLGSGIEQYSASNDRQTK